MYTDVSLISEESDKKYKRKGFRQEFQEKKESDKNLRTEES
jgi:hypothetical protein